MKRKTSVLLFLLLLFAISPAALAQGRLSPAQTQLQQNAAQMDRAAAPGAPFAPTSASAAPDSTPAPSHAPSASGSARGNLNATYTFLEAAVALLVVAVLLYLFNKRRARRE